MSEVVATERMLGRRNGALALLLTYFLSVAGFAYVRRLQLGVAYVVLPLLLMFMAGRLGIASTVGGFYGLMGLLAAVLVGGLVVVFQIARATPVPSPARWYNRWYHYAWIGICVVLLANVIVRHRGLLFGYEQFRIPSTSMEPTLQPGDFVMADTRAATMATIERGDVVTYIPNDHPGQVWVARVIGLPDESIAIDGHHVAIDGRALAESYLPDAFADPGIPAPHLRVVLGTDEYFLLGDNRPSSLDSRFQGPYPRKSLLGKVKGIWFSLEPRTYTLHTARIGPLSRANAR